MAVKPFSCTPETPWTPNKGVPVRHTNAKLIEVEDHFYGGSTEKWECEDCGEEWEREGPDY